MTILGNKKITKGFTLIELMIAVSLFTVVMTISATMFLRSIDIQAKAINSKSAQEGINYALAIISNEATNAIQDPTSCDGEGLTCLTATDFFCSINSGAGLRFRNSNSECVLYEIDNDPTLTPRLKVTRGGQSGYITPENVRITSLKFNVSNANDTYYPIGRMTIEITGESLIKEEYPETIKLQTTVATWPTQ